MDDPALEAMLWHYRIVDDGGDSGAATRGAGVWRLDVFRGGRWDFAGRWTSRVGAERKMRESAYCWVHLWRCGLARAFHTDYRLVSVDVDEHRTVLTEQVRRYFWHDTKPRLVDGYVAA